MHFRYKTLFSKNFLKIEILKFKSVCSQVVQNIKCVFNFNFSSTHLDQSWLKLKQEKKKLFVGAFIVYAG